MSTVDCSMLDTSADDPHQCPIPTRGRTSMDINQQQQPAHLEYNRNFCLLLNNSPTEPTSTRISNNLSGELSSYEQYESEMPSGCTYFRSADELPVFRIQSISPTSRSLSPIEFNEDEDDDDNGLLTFSLSPCGSTSDLDESPPTSRFPLDFDSSDPESDRISIASINALIGTTPPTSGPLGKRLNLETIFEGVFLHTPPAQQKMTARVKAFVEDQQKHSRRLIDLPEMADNYCGDLSTPLESAAAAAGESCPTESLLLLSIRN